MKLDTQVQRRFGTAYHKMPPSRTLTPIWYKQFKQSGSVLQKRGAWRPYVPDKTAENILEVFVRSTCKST